MRSSYVPPTDPVTLPGDERAARDFTRGMLYGIAVSSAFWIAAGAALIVSAIPR